MHNYQIQNYTGQEIETLLGKIENLGLATTSNPGTMSAEDKTKLNEIAEGAQENVIESVKIDGRSLTPSSKAVNIETDAAPTKDSEKLIKSKAVYSAIAKYGVISQTQTWTQANFTDYTMSNIVRGPIPKSSIDLFVAAGAVFNEATGYFELNGLTDLSYEEMLVVYRLPRTNFQAGRLNRLYACQLGRTNFAILAHATYGTLDSGNAQSFCLNNQYMEAVALHIDDNSGRGGAMRIDKLSHAFYSCRRLKRIIGEIYCSLTPSLQDFSNTFGYCFALEEVRLLRLAKNISFADSSNLSKDSLLYMINNETATSPIVITLHSSVYAKCQEGGDWYSDVEAALDEHTNVSLATA